MNEPNRPNQKDRLRFSAVALGVCVNYAIFVASVAILYFSVGTTFRGFDAAALAIGFVCTCLGAYCAGRIGKTRPIQHGLCVAGIIFVISLARFIDYSLAPPNDLSAVHPLWFELIGWMLIITAGYLGGIAAQRALRAHTT